MGATGKPALHRQQVAAVPGFCCAPLPWKAFQAFPLRLIDSYNHSFTEQSTWGSQARQKKKEQRREKENVCQIHSPYCKLPSRPPWTSPLGWRCLEDRGRCESKGGGQRNQRNSGVERCEGGGDRPGGRSQGGLHSQVLQLCPSGHGRNHPPCSSLWLLWSQKREPVPPLPLQYLRLHHPPPPDRRYRLHQH